MAPRIGTRRRGIGLVVSSPSGAGKTTLSRRLASIDDNLEISVSATTREPRPGESEGEHYYFVSRDEFWRMAEAAEFLEHAEVFGNFYGTPRRFVEERLDAGRDVIFDIDWRGARLIREALGSDVVCAFILPPSPEAQRLRLRSRAQDSAEAVDLRMAGALDEIGRWPDYDYVLVNEWVDETLCALQSILAAARLQRSRQLWVREFVRRYGEAAAGA